MVEHLAEYWSGPKGQTSADDLERSSSPRNRSDAAFSTALFVIALSARLLVALAWAKEPVWDGHYYHFGAERIAEGYGYSESATIDGQQVDKPWAHYPVGYSAVLGLAYRLFGSGLVTAPVVNALIGALLVVVTHRFARYYLSENRARIAGSLCALHPGLIAYAAVVMTEPLAALLILSSGWAALAYRTRWRGAALAGLLLGLSALVRPSSLLAAPALLLVFGKPWKKGLLQTSLALVVALLSILPWTIRNCQVMDGCALISTNGGWNLAIGAITETGRFQALRATDGCPVVTGQVQQDRCWAQVGWNIIKNDPGEWLAKIPAKLSQTYDHESFAVEYLHETAPQLWPDARRKAGRELLTLVHRVLIVLAALSPIAIVTSSRRPSTMLTQGLLFLITLTFGGYCFANDEHPFFVLVAALPLVAALQLPGSPAAGPAGRYAYALLFATTLTHAIFFGDDRYHLVISPVLCILAAAALHIHSDPPPPQAADENPPPEQHLMPDLREQPADLA